MAMGIVSDKDFNAEKSKLVPSPGTDGNKSETVPTSSQVNGVIKDVNRGRGIGSVEVPNSLRNVIGDESQTNGRQSAIELAQSFGLSPSSVSAYDVGATSTASYGDRPNAGIVKQAKERIAKRARIKLMSALSQITEEKLEKANAKDLAGIAKDMAGVVKTMEPEDSKEKVNTDKGPTFVFYAPQFRKEEHFDVIQAKD